MFADPLVCPQWQKKMAEVDRGECPHGTEVMNRVMFLTLFGIFTATLSSVQMLAFEFRLLHISNIQVSEMNVLYP